MSMFDWQATNTMGPQLLSENFWIFWAVSVPLTIVVIVFWWAWWHLERKAYDKEMGQAVENVDRTVDLKVDPVALTGLLVAAISFVLSAVSRADNLWPKGWWPHRGLSQRQGTDGSV